MDLNLFWNLLNKITKCEKESFSKLGNFSAKGSFSVKTNLFDNCITFSESGVLILEDGTKFNSSNTILWKKSTNKISFSRKRCGEFEELFEIGQTTSPHTWELDIYTLEVLKLTSYGFDMTIKVSGPNKDEIFTNKYYT